MLKIHLSTIVFAAMIVSGCGQEKPAATTPARDIIRLSDQFSGDFELIDKNGATVVDEDFNGKIGLIYFGFTHCPDVCPIDVDVMSATLNELGEDASEIAPIFISVDPERDTPEALRDYFTFDDRLIALTGSVEAAAAARQSFKLLAQKEPLPDSALEYTVQHQRFFFINDRTGQPQWAIIGGKSPQELAQILRRSIEEL